MHTLAPEHDDCHFPPNTGGQSRDIGREPRPYRATDVSDWTCSIAYVQDYQSKCTHLIQSMMTATSPRTQGVQSRDIGREPRPYRAADVPG